MMVMVVVVVGELGRVYIRINLYTNINTHT